MAITYDPAKRDLTLLNRGIDFADAEAVFSGLTMTLVDDRSDYGEIRLQTYGLLDGRLVMIVWTERAPDRHIISMRKCNDREERRFRSRLA